MGGGLSRHLQEAKQKTAKTYSGRFVVQVEPEIHVRAAIAKKQIAP
ncbi:toxin-antitoxin system HicB family antitoxin [Undibacterium flavidum]|nr:toxin-antitoxin system HicB family antitoxin [Undibacterium flavidum]